MMKIWFHKLLSWIRPDRKSPTKVVIDTSVLVAAFFRSKSLSILESWRKGELIVCYSPDILKEYKLILNKIPPIQKKSKDFFTSLNENPATIKVEKPPKIDVNIEDPDDLKFISCAEATGADYIISLDQHLLRLKSVKGIDIVRPREFIVRLGLAS